MSEPAIVKGQFFSILVDQNATGDFVKACGFTTQAFEETAQTSDDYIRDCSDPYSVPVRALNITGTSAQITGTAYYNRAQAQLMRDIFAKPIPVRFVMGEDASDPVDSGYYEGKFGLTTKSVTAPDGATVTQQVTWQNDGKYTWVPGAEIVALHDLSAAPLTATHGTAWSGSVTGLTAGSTLAATSSTGETLTVTGTGTTRTVAGTFTDAGNSTITLTEALADATNSPKVTTVIVAVA